MGKNLFLNLLLLLSLLGYFGSLIVLTQGARWWGTIDTSFHLYNIITNLNLKREY